MPGGQYIALSGMRTRLDHLDRVAGDIANAGTSGYKTERVADAQADRPTFNAMLQSAIDVTSGGSRVDLSSGALTPTGRDLDLAISGNGFFTVQTAGGSIRYTRNGHFNRQPDGTLATDDGATVLDAKGQPIKVSSEKASVDADGTIGSGGTTAGKLGLVEFSDPSKLTRESGTVFNGDAAGVAPARNSEVKSGSLEGSNVSVVQRVAELTDVTRSFEALQKAISLQLNDLDGKAIDILGRR